MTYEEAKDSIALGRYRHFKGKEYELLAIARHSETKEPMVVYKALYSDEIYGDRAVWIRPATMWNEEVERDGKKFRRFEKVSREQKPCENLDFGA